MTVDTSFTVFFFQAEDGIRDGHVTGVQTCALPILPKGVKRGDPRAEKRRRFSARGSPRLTPFGTAEPGRATQIGRASCRKEGSSPGTTQNLTIDSTDAGPDQTHREATRTVHAWNES